MSTTIESLELEIRSSSTSAVGGIYALSVSLTKLKNAVKGGVGLTAVSNQINKLNTALQGLGNSFDKIHKLTNNLSNLKAVTKGGVGLTSVSNQMNRLNTALQGLDGSFDKIHRITSSLLNLKAATKGGIGLTFVINQINRLNTSFQSIDSAFNGKVENLIRSVSKLSALKNVKIPASIGNQLKNIVNGISALNTADFSGVHRLVDGLSPLNNISNPSGLKSIITQLQKLPQLAQTLRSMNWLTFTTQLKQLAYALAPLANQLNTVSTAFARLPSRIRQVVSATNALSPANSAASRSYIELWARCKMFYNSMKGIGNMIASWINKSNQYIEDVNLFTVSMGQYASEAQEYAEKVSSIMGIDPGEWMRNQGVFMTITEGFGVASDRAYIMSKNLTQLGYDLSSFFNIGYEDAMQKLQSGISGELEPLRRLGYDLSQARLQQEALNLGITKSFSAMTQAEKAQLRYHAIMTQVTTAQGDMARTLNAPANQLRVLRAEIEQCSRALGNIFIPALNAILPYAIAVVKVIRAIAEVIASLFHFELPSIDTSGFSVGASTMGSLADNANNAAGGIGGAAKAAKKLKNALLGIDELNIISPDDDTPSGGSGGAGGGGGGFDFPLPEYDFLKDAVDSKINDITTKLKEWLGLTDEINTWSDLFHTRLGRILTTIGAIGAGLLAWKLSQNLLSALEYIKNLKNLGLDKVLTISIGVSLIVAGIALEAAGIIDAIQNELNGMNLAQIIAGSALITIGGATIGKALGNATIGGAIGAIVGGLPAYITGVYISLRDGISGMSAALTAFGSTLVGAGIGALIGLAVGLVTDGVILIMQHWDEIVPFLTNFFQVTLPSIWNNFKAKAVAAIEALGQILGSLPNKITEMFHNIWQPIQDFDWYNLGHKIGELLGQAFQYIFTDFLPNLFTEKIPSLLNSLVSFIPTAVGWALEMGVAVGNGIIEGLKTIWETAIAFFKGLIDGIKQTMGDGSLSETIANTIKTVITKIKDLIVQVLQSLPGLISQLLSFLGETIRNFDWNGLGKIVGMALGTALKLALGALKILITDVLPGVIKGIVPFFANLPENLFKAFVGAIKWIFEIGVEIVKGLLEGLGSIIEAVIEFFKGIIDGVKEVFGIHSPSTVFMEIGKNLIAGLLEGIKSLWSNIVNFFKEKLEAIKQVFSNAWLSIKQTAITAWEGITTFLSTVWNNIKEIAFIIWESIKMFFSETWNAIKEVAVTVFESIEQFIEKTWENIKTTASKVWKSIITTLSKIWDTLKETVSKVFDTIKEIISKTWDTIQSVTSNIWESITNFLSKTWETLKNKVSTIFNAIKTTISNIWNAIKSITLSVWENIKSFLNTTWETLKNTVSTVFNAIKETISNIWNNIKTITSTVWENIKNFLNTTWQGLKTLVSTVFNAIKDIISTVWNTVKTVTSTIWESIKNFLNTTWQGLKTLVSTVFNAIKDTINNIWNTIKTITSTVWESIKTFLSNIWNTLKTTVTTTFNNIKDTISNIWNTIKNTTSDIWGNIKEKLSDIWDNIKNKARDKFENIGNVVSDVWEDIARAAKSWGKDIIDNLVAGIRKKIDDVKRVVSDVAGTISDFLHFSEPDKGPLSNFHTFMPDMMELMTKGIKDNSYIVLNTISDLTNSMARMLNETPTLALETDYSALNNYDSLKLSRSVSANVQTSNEVTATGLKEAMVDFYHECLQNTMTQMSEDMRRQANKKEQTVVQVGNRMLMEAVETQKKANGYQFVK